VNFENILNKARENPEADLNVQGKNWWELEEKYLQCKEKIEQQAKQLHITSVKLAKTEKHILGLANLLSHADNNIEKTSKEKESLDKELSVLKDIKSDLGESLEETAQKLEIVDKKLEYYTLANRDMMKELSQKEMMLNNLKIDFKQSIVQNNEDMKDTINNLMQIIADKEEVINDLKEDMLQSIVDKNKEIEGELNKLMEKITDYDDVINKLENDLEIKAKQIENTEASFELAFVEKDKIIKKLKARLAAKVKNIEELTNRVEELEEKVLESHASVKILEEIRKLMLDKGFINDKELNELTKEIEKQKFMIFY